MRFANIDLEFCQDNDLSLSEGLLVAFCMNLPAWADKSEIDGQSYYWACRTKICEELPILTDKPDTVYRLVRGLASKGILVYLKLGQKDLIGFGPVAAGWNRSETRKKIRDNSENFPNQLGKKSESARNKIRHNNKEYNNKEKSNKEGVGQNRNFAHAPAPDASLDLSLKDSLKEKNADADASNPSGGARRVKNTPTGAAPTQAQVEAKFLEGSAQVEFDKEQAGAFLAHYTNAGWPRYWEPAVVKWKASRYYKSDLAAYLKQTAKAKGQKLDSSGRVIPSCEREKNFSYKEDAARFGIKMY